MCCGYGSFIVRAFINESNASYTGVELNISAKAVAEMRSDILGSDITILTNDVMTYEAESKFDKIFSDPPYGVTTFNVENASNRPLQFLNQAIPGLPRRYSSNWLFATAVLNNLAENGKTVVCVTPNAAFGTGAGDVEARRYFVEHGLIEAVIALPANMSEVTAIPILLKQAEKRIAELDKLFTRLYEDNVLGRLSDERFTMMSAGYEDEQAKLKATVAELTAYIDTAEQKSSDVTAFLKVVHKYEHIEKLTPEIMHELVDKIVVHEPDKSSGKRVQDIEIHFRFDVAVSTISVETGKLQILRNC